LLSLCPCLIDDGLPADERGSVVSSCTAVAYAMPKYNCKWLQKKLEILRMPPD
jgi:hypothetical protein